MRGDVGAGNSEMEEVEMEEVEEEIEVVMDSSLSTRGLSTQ